MPIDVLLRSMEEETTRPHAHCQITNGMRIHYPARERWLKYCISVPLVVVFTAFFLIVMSMIYANRDIILAQYYMDGVENIFYVDWSIAAIGRIDAVYHMSI